MSEVKKPAAKKSTDKGRTKPKKSGARKPAQKQSVKSNPVDQALTLVAKKFVKAGGTKLLLKVFPYLLFGYFGNKMAYAYRVTEAPDFFNKLMGSLSNLGPAFENILPSFNLADLLFGAVFGVGMRLVVYFKSKNAKKFRKGEEYGSARWGNAKDIEPYMDLNNPENNVILTQTEGLIMNGKPKGPKYARNKNILVIGGSGSGKTRFFVKPNLDEKDILKLVNTLIVNTKGEGQQATEDFWVKAEKLLYQAYIGYIFYECVEEEQNFITLIDMINASETREDDESFKNAIDLIFEELEADEPDHFAVKQYKKYKLAAGKTAKSILISCGARLAPFDIKELRDLTEYDEMELDQIGERKTALFMIMSDTDGTFNFILAMMQSQMFNLLCECADDKHNGKLPVHVRFLLDEFANIGQIPQFDKLIATIRSREISASIILQSKSQLKAIYKDNADTIEGNCDTTLFLGGKEKTTLKEMSEILGKETIDLYNTSDTRGQSPSYGLNYQKTGKELMSQDEIAVMDGGKCIMQLRGVRPFFSDKFDITRHKRYKELSDFDEANLFDVEAFLSTKLKMKKSQIVETYEMGVVEDDA